MNATDTIMAAIEAAPSHEAMRIAVDIAMVLESWTPRDPSWVTELQSDPVEVERARRHAKEDRLPKERAAILADILAANNVRDHDSAQADTAYREWKRNGRKGSKPMANLGGMLDGFCASKDGRKPCCLLEAFEHEIRGMRTWRDVGDVLPLLADSLGYDFFVMPDDVIERHIAHDVEINGGCDAE